MSSMFRSFIAVVLTVPVIFLSACKDEQAQAQANPPESETAARVSVVTVQQRKVVVFDELPGRVSAFRTAEIRPQVSGIIQKRLFNEGAEVDRNEPLFQIDAAPFSADVEASSAILARMEAELLNAQIKFDRAEVLSSQKILSAESFNNATAALAQAKANVAEARANLTRRKLELSYASIRSPIAGLIGQALMSEGGLASSSATTPLAVVQQIDRVYVDIRQSSMTREALEDLVSAGESDDAAKLPVQIFTVAGKLYEEPGQVLFSDMSVDAGTGSVGIRVEVPNPNRQLLPGMYIRAKVPRSIHPDALTVPQEAVLRDPSGRPQLIIVGADKTASRRNVQVGSLVDGQYMIVDGLSAGETVVVLGQDRIQGGVKLETVPYRPVVAVNKS
ncbi:efflux RND transporter periplasmic adaptor subunit [Rhizobium vallis]|uniref:Efflux RND transporter periplasmic adaptor subunit n=1 Tax=Rhizobium vallis TaxID=634290 RepID=A0A3S0Y711_9HYPH|nr:efflux RND transporter periplasmic adaptor subunit [Rhizobium vallis]RUM25840.1 efflux RND transporter periplasmic adaptor subunit [Rhizobium vallis]